MSARLHLRPLADQVADKPPPAWLRRPGADLDAARGAMIAAVMVAGWIAFSVFMAWRFL